MAPATHNYIHMYIRKHVWEYGWATIESFRDGFVRGKNSYCYASTPWQEPTKADPTWAASHAMHSKYDMYAYTYICTCLYKHSCVYWRLSMYATWAFEAKLGTENLVFYLTFH